jgi:Bacterial Ig-like domain (group 2)
VGNTTGIGGSDDMKVSQISHWLGMMVVVAGCGSSTTDGASGSTAGSGAADTKVHGALPKEFSVFPEKIWTGFDGTNSYKAPVIAVSNKGEVKWTIDDPSIATLDPNSADPKAAAGGVNLMITATKAGTTMIHATDGTTMKSIALEVVAYPAAQWEAGKARYMMGPDEKNPACKECHAPGKGPDHTPTELDADTDDEVRNTFVTGKDPEGRPVDYQMEYTMLLKGYDHMWKVTADEKVGLVAYLRSLKPLHFPEYDSKTTQK